MSEAAILEGLSKSKLAVELNDEERRVLAAAMTLRDLQQGEVLIREGSADDHLYVVASGVLGVVKGAGLEEELLGKLWHREPPGRALEPPGVHLRPERRD